MILRFLPFLCGAGTRITSRALVRGKTKLSGQGHMQNVLEWRSHSSESQVTLAYLPWAVELLCAFYFNLWLVRQSETCFCRLLSRSLTLECQGLQVLVPAVISSMISSNSLGEIKCLILNIQNCIDFFCILPASFKQFYIFFKALLRCFMAAILFIVRDPGFKS